MKKLLASFAVLSLLVSCGGNKPGPEPTEQGCPKGAVDLGIVLPRLDKDGNPMKDADGNEITYKLYWAQTNLSETGLCAEPEDYGDYYVWGELFPHYAYGHSQESPCEAWRNGKTGYDWASYQWSKGGYKQLTKYCTVESYWKGLGEMDGKSGFSDYDYADDVARYVLKGKWRIPTDVEWSALLTQCTCAWDDVKKGLTVTAENGNSLFIPASGVRNGAYSGSVDRSGYYWSSVVEEDNPDYAIDAWFNFQGGKGLTNTARYNGVSVRPVSE